MRAAVEDALRVVHLAVAQQVDDRLHEHHRRGSAGGRREGVDHVLERAVVVGGGEEPRLEGARRQVDALVEHRVEERLEHLGVLARRGGVVAHRLPVGGEEDAEHVAARLHDVGYAGPGQLLADRTRERRRGRVDVGVDLVGRQPQRGQPGGGRDRVTGEGARLVDRPVRREHRHHVGPAAERRGREAAAHHLAEGDQVGAPALAGTVEAPLTLAGDPEAGHHLVGDEQRAVLGAGLGEELVEAGLGRDHAHVAGRGLGDQAGDLGAALGERRLDGLPVVVGQHQGGRGRGRRDAGGARRRRPRSGGVGQTGAGLGEQGVDVAVVAAGELHHDVAAGEPARQPDGRHGGLGAGGDQAHLLDRRTPHDLLGELDLAARRGAVRRAAAHRLQRPRPRPRGGRGPAAAGPRSRSGRRTRSRRRRAARRPCRRP